MRPLDIGITGYCVRPTTINVGNEKGNTVGGRRRQNLNLVDDYLSSLWEMVTVDFKILSVPVDPY